jgi:hypothetical protein
MCTEKELDIEVVFDPPLEHESAKEWLDSMTTDDRAKFLKHVFHDRACVFRKSQTD